MTASSTTSAQGKEIEHDPPETDQPLADLVSIGEAANRSGVSERTLRYYEQLGLLVPGGHSPGGSRRYGAPELARVRRIRELQELMGLNLEEIRRVLEHEDRSDARRSAWYANDDPTVRREILAEGLAAHEELLERIGAKLSGLERFRAELLERTERIRELSRELDKEISSAAR